MSADRLAMALVFAGVILLGAAAAYVLVTGQPAPAAPAGPVLAPAELEDVTEVIAGCIRIAREAAGGG